MTNLNDDVITHIMMCFDMAEVNDCFRLASICRRFYNCFQKNKMKIDDHFTHIMMNDNKETHYYGNKIHRSSKTSPYGTDDDLPAIIKDDGSQEWYRHGELHRDGDLAAIIESDGMQRWYQHGELHRDGDKPAVIGACGTQGWYQHGKLHRDGDKPAEIWDSGAQLWYQYGECHRDGDKPAVIWYDGNQEWYQRGVRYDP